MLTKQEREELIAALAQHLVQTPIGTLITLGFSLPERKELGEMPLNLTVASQQATWMVDACMTSKWRRDPSLIELLLNRLANQPGMPDFSAVLARIKLKDDPNPNPFTSFWVMANQPFLARPDLRKAAKDLLESVNQPILRVNGPSKSGKSYTTELFNFIMNTDSWPDLHVVPAKLSPGNGPTYSIEDLADELSLTLNPDPMPQRSTSSFPKALARWLVRNVNRNTGLWIFVLDGFGQLNVQPEVTEMIRQLVEYATNPEFARKMRLLLLDYDQDLVGNWRPWTGDDGPLLTNAVTALDLIACLQAFNQKMQVENPAKLIEPSAISTIADAMLKKSLTEPAQLPSLNEQLLKIAK